MPTANDLKARRANVWHEMQDLLRQVPDASDFTAEQRQKWDEMDAQIVSIDGDLVRMGRAADLGRTDPIVDPAVTPPAGSDRGGAGGEDEGPSEYERAFGAYLRNGMGALDPEQQRMLLRGAVDVGADPELRALGVATGGGGGFTVPEGFWNKVTETLKAYANVVALAELVTTDTGANLPWPTNDDTANEGEMLGENTTVTEGDIEFGQRVLGAHIFTSKMVKASLMFLQDTGIDAEAFVARKLGERIARALNRKLTLGTGAAQPQGFITGATVGKTTASATAITWEELVDLEHSVDAAYRQAGNCRYQFHDLILAVIRKMKDGDDRPLWVPSVRDGVPDTFDGYAYSINNFMDSTATATKKTIAFGDFRAGYAVRAVNGGGLIRLTERYADSLQVGFLGFGRYDGLVQDASAFKILQQAA